MSVQDVPTFNQLQEAMRIIKRNTGQLPAPVTDLIGQALRHYCDALHPFMPEVGADMFWIDDDDCGARPNATAVVADIRDCHGDAIDPEGIVVRVLRAAGRRPMFVAVRNDPETGLLREAWALTHAGAKAALEGLPPGSDGAPGKPARFAPRDRENLDPYGANNGPVGQ